KNPFSMTTSPNPASGPPGTVLNDTAQLSGGVQPYTGNITFMLFDPDQPGCSGTPVYTQVVAVSQSGFAQTSPGFVATKPGTYQWLASYSGGNNPDFTATCGLEPVSIQQPPPPQVPTLSGWGMLLFVVLLVGVGSMMLSRRRMTVV